ncbi:gliding motility lipoprotein GldH [Joostella atrarenae]|uniref:Gliding motility lipoprotein GldH n=1 Tax=Joostella atrarenae TaxID=679257 RepID=A0ABS9J0E2_9FLAO|nr:gliding motility lipoprotein GldH [Joostella atrarenae]MCF8713877.1 gliding motility lipoprotein GldH [Joostella atrarenae]
MHKRLVFLSLIGLLLIACDTNSVFSEYKAIKGGWDKEEEVSFDFTPKDSINAYDIFINLRNDNKYRFSNLYLIVNLDFPEGKTISDTLEYEMAKPNGEWLGKGFSSVKENKLFYKQAIVFPTMGNYSIGIAHAMRKNGSVEGVTSLEGITDVGISIEKSAEK